MAFIKVGEFNQTKEDKMSSSSSSSTGGIGVLGLLGIVFVVLKLTGFIGWSWWWVTLPFWGVIALVLGLCAIWLLLVVVDHYYTKARKG